MERGTKEGISDPHQKGFQKKIMIKLRSIYENYLTLARPPAEKSDVGKEPSLPHTQEAEGSWHMPRDGCRGQSIQCFSSANPALGSAADFRQRISLHRFIL